MTGHRGGAAPGADLGRAECFDPSGPGLFPQGNALGRNLDGQGEFTSTARTRDNLTDGKLVQKVTQQNGAGVKRVSLATSLYRAATKAVREAATEVSVEDAERGVRISLRAWSAGAAVRAEAWLRAGAGPSGV
mgnify:CR=1 FL=1